MCVSMEQILKDFEERGEIKGKDYKIKDGQILGLKYKKN